MTYGDDIAKTIAYWREDGVRASEVLCSMGEFGNEWKQVDKVMRRWRQRNEDLDRDLHHLSWDDTERELTGWYSTVLW